MMSAATWKSVALLENSAYLYAPGVMLHPFGELLSAHHLIQQLCAGGALTPSQRDYAANLFY